ncbi:hypothetical protein [Haliangium sp.]|uniref:hypothetical protein n=1 Tax=Haliangium sp. TaxID=2663208 RepID=UPI003D14CECA
MNTVAVLCWLAGLAALLAWLVRLFAQARRRPRVSRAIVVVSGLWIAALGASGAYVWGIEPAARGLARIAADRAPAGATPDSLEVPAPALAQATEPPPGEPPRARLFLRYVQMHLGAGQAGVATARVGYSPDAALRLPRSYGLSESRQGWDLVELTAAGPQGLAAAVIDHLEPSDTRVVVRAHPRAVTDIPTHDDLTRIAGALLGRGPARCRPAAAPATAAAPVAAAATAGAGSDDTPTAPVPSTSVTGATATLDGPGALFVFLCTGDAPRAALVFERDLGAAAADRVPVRVTPLVWRGRWRPHHVQITRGALIQIGTLSDALPGITLWEVPAPSGRAELFYPPDDLLASCAAWLSGRHGEGFFSLPPGVLMAPAPAPWQAGEGAVCVLPFTPPFGLEVRRLLPDVPGIHARSLWAAGLAVGPALLALLVLAARRRSALQARRAVPLLALGWLSALWSAASVWRLLWAHRIDMLRDYEAVGARVLANQLAAVLVAAALAATATLLWQAPAEDAPPERRFPHLRRIAWAGLAWLAWLGAGGYALAGDAAGLPRGAALWGQALLSLAVGTAPGWLPPLRAWLQDSIRAARAAPAPLRTLSPALLGLLAIALVAAATRLLAAQTVALKLTLAWTLGPALYLALRAARTPAGMASRPLLAALAGAALAGLCLAWLDPGVTAVIATPGALLAVLAGSHDDCFGDHALAKMHGYRRHLAPLLVAQAVLLGLVAAAVAGACAYGLATTAAGEPDAVLARTFTRAAMHTIAGAALLFVPAAALSYLRRGLRAALPWIAATAVLAGLWLARDALVDSVLGGSSQAAHRLAIVLDPGYALLHSENKFLAGITAWRETILPPAGPLSASVWARLADGQGYFGAQLIDPGVLLSIENDYFPVLVLREAGVTGVLATALLLALLAVGGHAAANARFRHGSAGQRGRALVATVLAVVCLYQPLAALGALPLTGVAWPGFGLDSPSDLWVLMVLGLWLLVWPPARPAPVAAPARRRRPGTEPPIQPEPPAPRPDWHPEALDRGPLGTLLEGSPTASPDTAADPAASAPPTLDDDRLEALDVELRRTRAYVRVRTLTAAVAALVLVAGLLTLARASAFALRRPNPVDLRGRTVAPFDDLTRAVDYAYRLQCPWSEHSADGPDSAPALIPDALLGEPEGPGITRFHAALDAAWRAQRERAVHELRRFLAGPDPAAPAAPAKTTEGAPAAGPVPPTTPACGAPGRDGQPVRAGAWRFSRDPDDPDRCHLRFAVGWPELLLTVTRAPAPDPDARADDSNDGADDADDADGGGDVVVQDDEDSRTPAAPAHQATCEVELRTDVLRALRFPARRPYRDARIRLVSRAMGAAARDRGELVSGHISVRLRPGAGAVDVAAASAGLYTGDRVRISAELSVAIDERGTAVLRRAVPSAAQADPGERDTWLFVRDPPASRIRILAAEEGTWKLLPPEIVELPLQRLTLIVVGGPDARSLWLFRPPRAWSDEPGESPVVDPLLADDIATVRGERRRHYLFGDLVPELGWVNPFQSRMSLGLDGWLRVAMTEYERAPGPRPPGPPTWLDGGRERPYCSALSPADDGDRGDGDRGDDHRVAPRAGQAAPDRADQGDPALARVCRESGLDGVLECRVSLQPELALRLGHLTELISLAPRRFGNDDSAAPVRAAYTLLRGDSGEILAQGEFVPGRASSAYAPATPELEQHLVRLREDRDPDTGRRLPPARRGEASAEKAEWSQPVAVGSTMKPLLARALEHADPDFARALVLDGAPVNAARCPGGKVHALLGHCPPTDSLWNHHGRYGLADFIAVSVNWYHAAIGLLGTAVPGGAWGFGDSSENGEDDGLGAGLAPATPAAVTIIDPTTGNLGAHDPERALWTRWRGRDVITAAGTIDIVALRRTPMWQAFERLLGRPLCTGGSKRRCRRAHTRRDLCAARALPIARPSRDLRHLVALGPATFDFYPPLADPSKRADSRVSTREYLQFLRGSGLHPLGSLAQMADAFNRLVYEYDQSSEHDGRYRLAASWFPVAAAGQAPGWDCGRDPPAGSTVRTGLCQVLRAGTARPLRPLLEDPRFRFHGAKTGTIDSLADLVEQPQACEHFRSGHTIADRPARDAAQPYWLPCGQRRAPAQVNDSLLLISFSVVTPAGDLPLTLGLRFQRSGPGFAAQVARHYLDVIHAYFGAPAEPVATPPQ